MKQFVDTKETEFRFGKTREVRGNFIEHKTEDGVQYECDYYRTEGDETFDELYAQEQAEIQQKADEQKSKEAHEYLNATDKYVVKCFDRGLVFSKEYPEMHEAREQAREVIRGMEEIR